MQPATHSPTASRSGVNPDEDSVLLWRRPLDLLEPEHLERAEPVVGDCPAPALRFSPTTCDGAVAATAAASAASCHSVRGGRLG
jgi:hypothetical protein